MKLIFYLLNFLLHILIFLIHVFLERFFDYFFLNEHFLKSLWNCFFLFYLERVLKFFFWNLFLLLLKMYRGEEGKVREVILISGQNQNCPFLKTDSLADTFFWTKNVKKNVKCYGEKVLEIFLTLKKNFFSGHFF